MLTLRQIVDRDCNHKNDPNGNDPDHEEVRSTAARSAISSTVVLVRGRPMVFAIKRHHQPRVLARSLPNVPGQVKQRAPSSIHLRVTLRFGPLEER